MSDFNSPQEIEKLLAHHRQVKAAHPESPYPPTFQKNNSFSQDQAVIDHLGYIRSGEHSYAIARLLFELRVHDYALFCGQQTVENYFKAFIKLNGYQPKMTHSLSKLLLQCRAATSAPSFIASEYVETIAERFNPFNEVARYPVQRTRPDGGYWVSYYPEDMHILDYFVFRMRELLPIPAGNASLFTDGTPRLMDFERIHPEVYLLIKHFNINFNDSGAVHRGA